LRRRSLAGPQIHLTPPAATDYSKLSYGELIEEARRLYESLQLAWCLELTHLSQPNWKNLEDLDEQLHRIETGFSELGGDL
jgi:hypothetical protein